MLDMSCERDTYNHIEDKSRDPTAGRFRQLEVFSTANRKRRS